MKTSPRQILGLLARVGAASMFFVGPAAASSLGTDERLTGDELIEPNIIFLIDMSQEMSDPCDSSSTASCFDDAKSAINRVVQHYDDARYGVFGTAEDEDDAEATPIAPVGSKPAEIQTLLSTVSPWGTETRNLAESLQWISENYLQLVDVDNGIDNDPSDGSTGDWDESPIAFSCSETHIVVLTRDRPLKDGDVTGSFRGASPSPSNIRCDADGETTSDDIECMYDDVVTHLYNLDEQSLLTDTQRVIVHTLSIGSQDTLSESLWVNAQDQTDGSGVYANAGEPDYILGAILDVMNDVMSGTYSRSSPVLTADDAYLIYTFYEIAGDNPLAEGHIRAYELDNDPSSVTYGQINYTGDPETTVYGGAKWDGGDLLVCRPVDAGERQFDDRDGVDKRDIYTWDQYAADWLLPADNLDKRLGYDEEFGTAVAADSAAQSRYMDMADLAYDLDGDDAVTGADYQKLIDFVRGFPGSTYRYIDQERGYWKLGDSPYSVPVVVTPRDEHYTNNLVYKSWLEDLEFSDVPSIVLIAANDGMLHAFAMEDDEGTATYDEAGTELWAWVPGALLLEERTQSWEGRLIDMMLYGRSFLFDGSPVVEDVWIDADSDGAQTVDEWHRVVVVQQGMGGYSTLALDITDPRSPEFLWEAYENLPDQTALGYTTGKAVIANVYDSSAVPSGGDAVDRYVVFWGSGRAAKAGSTDPGGYDSFSSTEPNLYLYAMGDTAYNGGMTSPIWDPYDDAPATSEFPDTSTIDLEDFDLDDDGKNEYAYVSGPIAAVDANNDGDVDVLYFPLSTTYMPYDEAGAEGGGGGDVDTGLSSAAKTEGGDDYGTDSSGSSAHTFIMKAVLNSDDPGNPDWCLFYDPLDGVDEAPGPGIRPEVYYQITTAWLGGGTDDLGVYWGSGTPFDRAGDDPGYFFAFRDPSPMSCSTPEPLGCGGDQGWMALDAAETLASDPFVYAGYVYFTTYLPNTADECELGEGRIYALDFADCSGGFDTDDDGTPDASYISTGAGKGYASNLALSDQGTLFYAVPGEGDYTDPNIQTVTPMGDDFKGTVAVQWMEMF